MNTPHTLLIGKRKHKSLKINIVTRFHPPLKTRFHEFTFSPPGEYSYLIIYHILTSVFIKIILYALFNCFFEEKRQIKKTKRAFQCLNPIMSGNIKVDNMILMRHSFQLIDFNQVIETKFYMFLTGCILRILSHLSPFYRPFRTQLSRFGLYMRLFSRFSFNGV